MTRLLHYSAQPFAGPVRSRVRWLSRGVQDRPGRNRQPQGRVMTMPIRWPVEQETGLGVCNFDHRPCSYPRCCVCPRVLTALEEAERVLRRAADCDSSMLRADYLYRARDALVLAGLPRWAEIAEAEAGRIGGDGESARNLRRDVGGLLQRTP